MSDVKANILVIESSTSAMRISVSNSTGTIKSVENTDRFSHAENIIGLIEKALANSGMEREDLEGIVVSKGPGSFTGLRIGMATAKGLAISLSCPLASVPIFSAAAVRLPDISKKTAVLIPSRREEYYLGIVDDKPFDENSIEVIRAEELLDKVGKLKVFVIDIDPYSLPFPKRQVINPDKFSVEPGDYIISAENILEKGGDDLEKLEPLYIQPFPAVKKS